jgi:hypothetical protein
MFTIPEPTNRERRGLSAILTTSEERLMLFEWRHLRSIDHPNAEKVLRVTSVAILARDPQLVYLTNDHSPGRLVPVP